MANEEHVERLQQGSEQWNRWRKENPGIKPDFICVDLSYMDLSYSDLRLANFRRANLQGVDFRTANLSNADLSHADCNRANLSGANLSGVNLNRANLSNSNLSYSNLNRANLDYANLCDADLRGAELIGAKLRMTDLSDTNLSYANFSGTDLRSANFSDANLFGANLSFVQALSTIFQGATLTGVCIEDWHINSNTNFRDVVCEYIFISSQTINNQLKFIDRRPHNSNRIFAPGEFTERYQILLESVELFFNDGIDWQAFLSTFISLQAQYGEDSITIQGFERKGNGFEVKLVVTNTIDIAKLEKEAYEKYETELRIMKSRYHVELQAKDKEIEIYKQQSTNLWELAKLAASRPITVEAKAVAENQSHSETFNNNLNGAIIGSLANKMQDHASQHSTQYIGTTPSEITTLIQSLRSLAESFPQSQRTEAIDHLEDLEGDLKQPPEKRKPSRIKATLLALVASATAISGTVASTNEFVGQVQELSEKLGIPLPIEQVQSASQSDGVIDVEAIQRKKP